MKSTWVEKIQEIDIDKLKEIVSKESTYKDVLNHFNINTTRSNTMYNALRKVMDINNIDYSHFGYKKIYDLETVLCKNSTYNNQTLKKRIIKENLIPYKCIKCENTGQWNGTELVLQLDHINGINNDNRIENLRFLCPNCHSQTSTFAGKNMGRLNNWLVRQTVNLVSSELGGSNPFLPTNTN